MMTMMTSRTNITNDSDKTMIMMKIITMTMIIISKSNAKDDKDEYDDSSIHVYCKRHNLALYLVWK